MSLLTGLIAFLPAILGAKPKLDDAARDDIISLELKNRDLTRDLDAARQDNAKLREDLDKARTNAANLSAQMISLRMHTDELRMERDHWRDFAAPSLFRASQQRFVPPSDHVVAVDMLEEATAMVTRLGQLPPAAFGQLSSGEQANLAHQASQPFRAAMLDFCNCVPARHDVLRPRR